MSLISKLTRFARSPQGRRYTQQAMTYARSPEGKRRIADARRQLAARQKPTSALTARNLDTTVSGFGTLRVRWTP